MSAPPDRGVRLQRVLADAGVASRRECEAMIERGRVEVNGQTVTRLPVFVDPARDRISVDGRPLRTGPAPAAAGRRGRHPSDRVYVMLHKPDRVLCTTRDDAAPTDGGRTTVLDLVHHRSGARLYPVGRLDYHCTGLVLLTNDGDLADRLTHARYGTTRTYRVTVKGQVRPDVLDDLRRRVGKHDPEDPQNLRGVRIARAPGTALRTDRPASPNTVLEITLREGRSRRLQVILEQMGCIVRKLTRVGIGPLRLSGVAVGQWRDLTREEVTMLKRAAGASDLHAGKGPAAQPAASGSTPGGHGPERPRRRHRRESAA